MITRISVGELRRVLSEESRNEFRPVVFGEKESGEINRKAYRDIEKETSEYDGGLTSNDKRKGEVKLGSNANRGMHDLVYDDINKPYKEKVKSQMKGYVSKEAEKLHKDDAFGNATFDDKGEIYNAAMKHAEAVKDGKDKAVQIGLTGRELDKEKVDKNRETMAESKKIKMVTLKKTRFLSEGHMMSMIPDEYKKEGNRFIMRDGIDNQYLVEWSAEPSVTKKPNMTLVNEQKERMRQLWGYRSAESNTSTPKLRIQEDNGFIDMVGKARKLNG